MLDILSYDWLRALHIIFMVAWMAALLMLPRLLVYQMQGQPQEPLFDTMVSAVERLRRIIMNPAMILTWVFGLLMLAKNWDNLAGQPWIWAKLTLVVALSGVHGWMLGLARRMKAGARPVTEKTLRLLNEVPFLIAIAAIIFVVVQPFAR